MNLNYVNYTIVEQDDQLVVTIPIIDNIKQFFKDPHFGNMASSLIGYEVISKTYENGELILTIRKV